MYVKFKNAFLLIFLYIKFPIISAADSVSTLKSVKVSVPPEKAPLAISVTAIIPFKITQTAERVERNFSFSGSFA